MILRKFLATSTLGAALLLSVPAAAETLRVGAAVTDPQGGAVGTITAVDSQYVTLRTDRHETRLPVASFTAADNAVLFGMTRDQLNAAVEQALASAQQAIQVGAVVHDRTGAAIGPVASADDQNVTVTFGQQPVQFPRSAIAAGPNGLVVGVTVAELQAQVGASQNAGSN
jgi:preprotein translocase subunit YajC